MIWAFYNTRENKSLKNLIRQTNSVQKCNEGCHKIYAGNHKSIVYLQHAAAWMIATTFHAMGRFGQLILWVWYINFISIPFIIGNRVEHSDENHFVLILQISETFLPSTMPNNTSIMWRPPPRPKLRFPHPSEPQLQSLAPQVLTDQ